MDPEEPVTSLKLLAPNFQRLLATDENNTPLVVETNASTVTINTLGASHVMLVYETNALTTLDGAVWTLKVNIAVNATVILPANSQLVFVNPKPIRVSDSTPPAIEISAGTWEISYNLLQSAPPSPPPRSGCLIATATYGGLAEPVESLRSLRDTISQTAGGRSFLVYFNSWYYSWSPGAADGIRHSILLRSAATLALTPLIAALSAARHVHGWAERWGPEAAIYLTGIAVSASLGAIYLTPLFCVLRRVRRLSNEVMVMTWNLALFASPLMPIFLAPLVLSSMAIGGDLSSQIVLRVRRELRPYRPILSRSTLPSS